MRNFYCRFLTFLYVESTYWIGILNCADAVALNVARLVKNSTFNTLLNVLGAVGKVVLGFEPQRLVRIARVCPYLYLNLYLAVGPYGREGELGRVVLLPLAVLDRMERVQ